MPEQVFRVQGADWFTGAPRDVYVRGDSIWEARLGAGERGIIAPANQVEAVDESAVPPGAVILPRLVAQRPSALSLELVAAIALGVFVGMVAWSICAFMFSGMLGTVLK